MWVVNQFLSYEYHINGDGSGLCKTIVMHPLIKDELLPYGFTYQPFRESICYVLLQKVIYLPPLMKPDVYDILSVCLPFLSSLFGVVLLLDFCSFLL